MVDKYLPDISPETYKVHMKRQKKGLRTTQGALKEKFEVIETEQDIHPPIELDTMNKIFTSIAKGDKKDGTIYVSNTVNVSIRSIKG